MAGRMCLCVRQQNVAWNPPISILSESGSSDRLRNCTEPGIDFELFASIQTLLNFSFSLVPLLPRVGIGKEKDVNWDLETAVALSDPSLAIDFTLYCVALNQYMDSQNLTFAGPLVYTDRGFMVGKPRRDLYFLLGKPFSSEVWTCVLVATALVGVLSGLLWAEGSESSWRNRVGRSGWAVVMVGLQQSLPPSYYLHRRPYSQKFLLGLWMGASFILTTSYSAMLISVLLDVRPSATPFRDARQLAHLIHQQGFRAVIPAADQADFLAWLRILRPRPFFQSYVAALSRYPPVVLPDFLDVVERLRLDPRLFYPCRLTETNYRLEQLSRDVPSYHQVRCNFSFVYSKEENIATAPAFRHDFPKVLSPLPLTSL